MRPATLLLILVVALSLHSNYSTPLLSFSLVATDDNTSFHKFLWWRTLTDALALSRLANRTLVLPPAPQCPWVDLSSSSLFAVVHDSVPTEPLHTLYVVWESDGMICAGDAPELSLDISQRRSRILRSRRCGIEEEWIELFHPIRQISHIHLCLKGLPDRFYCGPSDLKARQRLWDEIRTFTPFSPPIRVYAHHLGQQMSRGECAILPSEMMPCDLVRLEQWITTGHHLPIYLACPFALDMEKDTWTILRERNPDLAVSTPLSHLLSPPHVSTNDIWAVELEFCAQWARRVVGWEGEEAWQWILDTRFVQGKVTEVVPDPKEEKEEEPQSESTREAPLLVHHGNIPSPRIFLLTALSTNGVTNYEVATSSKFAYAAHHGYSFFAESSDTLLSAYGEEDPTYVPRSSGWVKIPVILKAVSSFVRLDLLDGSGYMWTQDIVIKNLSLPLEHFLNPDAHIILTDRRMGPSTSAFFIRNTPEARLILQEWWEMGRHRWAWEEQGALWGVLLQQAFTRGNASTNANPRCDEEPIRSHPSLLALCFRRTMATLGHPFPSRQLPPFFFVDPRADPRGGFTACDCDPAAYAFRHWEKEAFFSPGGFAVHAMCHTMDIDRYSSVNSTLYLTTSNTQRELRVK